MKIHRYLVISIAMAALLGLSCNPDPTNSNETNTVDEMIQMISRTVDSTYIYTYEKTKFVPPEGKKLYFMGQDVAVIRDFKSTYAQYAKPCGWSAYFAVSTTDGIFTKSNPSTGEEFGYQHLQWFVDSFPNTVIHAAMWMVGKWGIADSAAMGQYDDTIKVFCDFAKKAKRPIYLRIGYEFDGIHNELEPTSYVKAYRHIVDVIRKENVTNIAYVWHSYAAPPYKDYPVMDWYPGDDYVDWFGASTFGHMNESYIPTILDSFVNLAREHKKPVMLAESAPVHFVITEEDITAWKKWYVNYFSFMYKKNIRAFAYINCNWDDYPGHRPLQWENSKLNQNSLIEKAWMAEVAKDIYLKESTDLYTQLGYQ